MKKTLLIIAVFCLLSWSPQVFADDETIENISIELSPDLKSVLVQWDALPISLMSDMDGYAIQWGMYQQSINNTESATKYLLPNLSTLWLRTATFDRETTYYVRVYAYAVEGRSRVLTNGSKILKFKLNVTNSAIEETEILEPNDPVIVNNVGTATNIFDIGKIRISSYDTFVIMNWSRPNVTSRDASGIMMVVSENQDLSDPVIEFKTDSLTKTSAKLEGLDPDTTYYAHGYFYKGYGSKFGDGETEVFKTQVAFTEYQKQKMERLYKSGRVRRPIADMVVAIEGTTPSTTTTTVTTVTPEPTTTVSTDMTLTGRYTRAQILKKIRDLNAEIVLWRNKLTTAVSDSSFTNAPPTSSISSGTKRLSVRERLRIKLGW